MAISAPTASAGHISRPESSAPGDAAVPGTGEGGGGVRLGHAAYLARRHFPELDGLRALCVLLVITVHVHGGAWTPLGGAQGVIGFFVLSGFLITTLCAREASARGRVALGAFFVRRAFRILPLYVVVLAAYVGFVLVLGQEPDKRAGLEFALPYYLTFTNEIALHWSHHAGAIPFFQTWSLGVEEKFYVVWPVLAYAVLAGRRRARAWVLVVGIAGLLAVQLATGVSWASWYGALAIGCLLALVLHARRGYRVVSRLAGPWSAAAAVVVLVADQLLVGGGVSLARSVYPWVVAWLIVALILADSPVARAARSRPAVLVGTRSYGMYLTHLLALAVVERWLRPTTTLTPVAILSLVLAAAVTFGIADVLHRTVEAPMVRVGRRLSRRARSAT